MHTQPRPRLMLAAVFLTALIHGAPACAARGVTPEEQEKINRAIDRGVEALRRLQQPDGTWAPPGEYHKLGYAGLPGLTLLECGAPATDPAVVQAARFVRQYANKAEDTYEISVALLFLDRLGDAGDLELIQTLAARLIAGQTATGGWGYKCPLLSKQQKRDLLQGLGKLDPPQGVSAPGQAPPRVQDVVPVVVRKLPVFQEIKNTLADPPHRDRARQNPTTDNSNTQFAMLALWAAGRHHVPIKRSRALIAQRFRTSQNSDGSWGYRYRQGGGEGAALFGGVSPTMTCSGLLGLAIGLDRGARPGGKEKVDPAVLKAFVLLGKHVGKPAGGGKRVPQGNLYLLWSIERVAVLYDLPTIAGKDWYRWATEMLLSNQQEDGSWDRGNYWGAKPPIDTSFALLVLKRANLAADLGAQLPFEAGQVERAVNTEAGFSQEKPIEPSSPGPLSPTRPVDPGTEPVVRPVESGTDSAGDANANAVEPPPARTGGGILWVLLAISILVLFASLGALIVYLSGRAAREDDRPRKRRPRR
jgi:hypothetical protein